MRRFLVAVPLAMLVACTAIQGEPLRGPMARSAGAATVVPSDVVTITKTPLDMSTGKPIGPERLVATVAGDASGDELLSALSSGDAGSSSAQGRGLFRVNAWHQTGCVLVICSAPFRHITDVDAGWIRSWNYVHAFGVAKYTPVDGGGWWHYDKPSQTYGGDTSHYYNWRGHGAGSGFYYRGTAQNIFSVPMVGDAYAQVSNGMWVHSNGTLHYRMDVEG